MYIYCCSANRLNRVVSRLNRLNFKQKVADRLAFSV
jgi:hypothetical protein